jgi:hypothetical protein
MNNERYGALDILATVVSNVQEYMPVKKGNLAEHRVSCHRCGNIRKRKLLCPRQSCPHIFCGRCADKMLEEHGEEVFADGCPVCQELCCCSNKTVTCGRQNHCYRKCPSTKGKNGLKTEGGTGNDSDYHIPAPALEILAQVVSDRPTSPANEMKKRKIAHPNSSIVSSGQNSDRPDQRDATKNVTTTPPEQASSHPSTQSKYLTRSSNPIIPIQPYSPDAASLSATYAMSSLSALSAAAGNYDQYTQNVKPRAKENMLPATKTLSSSPSKTTISETLPSQPNSDHSTPQHIEDEKSKPALPGNRILSSLNQPQSDSYMATAAALSDSSFDSYYPAQPKSSQDKGRIPKSDETSLTTKSTTH